VSKRERPALKTPLRGADQCSSCDTWIGRNMLRSHDRVCPICGAIVEEKENG